MFDQYIHPFTLNNEKDYYCAISNLEYAVGPIEIMGLATNFITETTLMMNNSITLFKEGYVDAAYYSMREAIELTLTIIFFNEQPKIDRDKQLRNWINKESFPSAKEMIKFCKEANSFYSEIISQIPSFPGKLGNLRARLSKYAHKQGLDTFYFKQYRERVFSQNDSFDISLTTQFEKDLKESISTIAILNLALDPFPLLLTDEEIFYRIQLLSSPYSEWFIKNYLKSYKIEKLKNTNFYKTIHQEIIRKYEKMSEPVYWANNLCPIINTDYLETYKQQSHLLNQVCKLCITFFSITEKIRRIQNTNDSIPYVRETKPPLMHSTFPFAVTHKNDSDTVFANERFGDVYYSSFEVDHSTYYVEHDTPLDSNELDKLMNVSNEKIYLDLT